MSDPASIANPDPRAIVLPVRIVRGRRTPVARWVSQPCALDATRQRLSAFAPTSMPMPAASIAIASINGLPATRKRLKPKYSK